jgi:L-lactate dehydrogenase complex protein LldG
MSDQRQTILADIRQYLAASAPFDALRQEPHTLPVKAKSVSLQLAPLERFKQALAAVGGHCQTVKNETEAAAEAQRILEMKAAHSVAVTDSPLVRRVLGQVKTDAVQLHSADKAALFACDAGVTGAQWGIAETGTLVLESNQERHRLASLVPPVHIALLEAVNLRQTLGEVLALIGQDLSRVVTFITGPSRTSDIELTLAIGVHGPAELYVIVIDESFAINGR